MRKGPFLAACALALAAAATSGRVAQAASPCTKAAAKQAIVSSSLPRFYRDVARGKYGSGPGAGGPYVVFCRDFTRDGRPDMVVSFASGGTAGDVAWFVFRRIGARWALALSRLRLYKVSLSRAGGDIVETQPVYKKNDPNCCPTGGFNHVRFHWNGARFAAVRTWHDRLVRP